MGRPGNASKCPAPPFKLRIGASAGSSRLRGKWRSFWTRTSDEYAQELGRAADTWQLFPLVCVPDLDSDSLRDCIVTGGGEEHVLRRAAAAERKAAVEVQAAEAIVLCLSDDCSPALAAPAGAAADDAETTDGGGGDDNSESKDPHISDEDAAFEEAEHAISLDEEWGLFGPDDGEGDADGDAGVDEPAAPRSYTASERAAASDVVATFVTCSLPPWDTMGNIGVLTDWYGANCKGPGMIICL